MRPLPLRVALTLGGLVFAAVPLARAQEKPSRVNIILGVRHAVSPPVRQVKPTPPSPAGAVIPLLHPLPAHTRPRPFRPDPVLQASTTAVTASNTTAGASFQGMSSDGAIVPDTNLAVGATQVVQVVNVDYAIYDKAGNQIQAPRAIHDIFAPLGPPCGTHDGGDPIVLYDQIAGRWLISQMGHNGTYTSNDICVAISTTSDARGYYNIYALSFGDNLPDYPKWGVWPDGYYLTVNLFRNEVGAYGISSYKFQASDACALPRSTMLNNGMLRTSQIVCFQDPSEFGLLPADFQGSDLPPFGAPEYFANIGIPFLNGNTSDTLQLFRFHVDFTTPGNSTFTGPIPVSGAASFSTACPYDPINGRACIPQPGTDTKLESVGDRLMYPLTYRNLRRDPLLVVAQTVRVSSSGQTGIRWYQIMNPDSSPAIAQQGTYSPDTTTYRWMGSIAQDGAGDIAMGYSVSNGTNVYPGIRIAGHDPSKDAYGAMEGETDVIDGTAHQMRNSRWGDYSSMSVDPTDDCTFWYTTEYRKLSGSLDWSTYIYSFKFNRCSLITGK